jgi:hypothetical protein
MIDNDGVCVMLGREQEDNVVLWLRHDYGDQSDLVRRSDRYARFVWCFVKIFVVFCLFAQFPI